MTFKTNLYIIKNVSRKNAGMAELADALDLESSSRGVQVRFLLPAPDNDNPNPVPIGDGFGFLVYLEC